MGCEVILGNSVSYCPTDRYIAVPCCLVWRGVAWCWGAAVLYGNASHAMARCTTLRTSAEDMIPRRRGVYLGKLNLSCDAMVANRRSHHIAVFERAHINDTTT